MQIESGPQIDEVRHSSLSEKKTVNVNKFNLYSLCTENYT